MALLKKAQRKMLDASASVLLIVGGLVHGGLAFGYNAVENLLGYGMLPEIVYGVVGLSAVYVIARNNRFMK